MHLPHPEHNNSQPIILQPPLYFAQDHVWSVSFHPTADILACSQITGMVQILKYNSEEVVPLLRNTDMHKMSVRFCQFNATGDLLVSCGEDKRLGFIDANGKVAHVIKKAHPSPINRCKFINQHTVISGDDDGLVKVWDLRTVVPVFQAQDQGEAITGFAFDNNISEFQIYTSCLNGTVAAYDMRQASDSNSKLLGLSDSIDQELAGIQIVKHGKYLICPSSEGSLVIFKRDQVQHHIDRIQGQPGSVDAIIKIDQNTVITGSQDGFLRGVSIYPNKIVQVLGQHEQQQNFPIQSLAISRCARFVASTSHDNSIKFYDVNDFVQSRKKIVPNTEQQIKMQAQLERQAQQQSSGLNWQVQQKQNSEDFESDDDEDSDEMEQDQKQQQKKKKKKKGKKMSIKARQKQIKKQNAKSFFKGL